MKKIFMLMLAGLVLSACSNKKSQEKAILDDVIKVHDKVMTADEQLMKNKAQLDTLVKQGNFTGKDTAKALSAKLVLADSVMDNWMHDFDPAHTGKSEEETIAYMNKQKKQITAIDSQLNAAVNESTRYLSKIKTK